MAKIIVLEDGKAPQFHGAWTVGEVLQMAQALAAWVERLQVNIEQPNEPTPQSANGIEETENTTV